MPFVDLRLKRFGALVALHRDGKDKHRNAMWLCQCDCGNTCRRSAMHLQTFHATNCGCKYNGPPAVVVKAEELKPLPKMLEVQHARKLTYRGKTKFLREWADEAGLKPSTLRLRLDVLGWSVKRALTTPAREKSPKGQTKPRKKK